MSLLELLVIFKGKKQLKVQIVYNNQIGMATKPIPVVTHPNQTQFDGFSPFWLGLGMGMGFPRFQNTGMGRVTGI